MSQKELLYYEDAVSHEDATIIICKELVKKLKDQELIDFMNNEIKWFINNDIDFEKRYEVSY